MTDELDGMDVVIPSNPADRKRIKDALHEIVGCYQFIDDKKSYIKDVLDTLKENYDIPKKIATKMARTMHKHNYQDVSNESTTFELLYETIVNTAGTAASADDSEED